MKPRSKVLVFFCALSFAGILFANHCVKNLANLIPSLAPGYLSTTSLRIERVDYQRASYAFFKTARLRDLQVAGLYFPREGVTRAQPFTLAVGSFSVSPSLPLLRSFDVSLSNVSLQFKNIAMQIGELRISVPRAALSGKKGLQLARQFLLGVLLRTELSFAETINSPRLTLSPESEAIALNAGDRDAGDRDAGDRDAGERGAGGLALLVPDEAIKKYFAAASLESTEAERAEYASRAFFLPAFRAAKLAAIKDSEAQFPDDRSRRMEARRILWARQLALHVGKEGVAPVLEASGIPSSEAAEAARRGIALSDRTLSRSEVFRRLSK